MNPRSEVHNIDCIEYMRQLPDKVFALAVADPPYGVSYARGKNGYGVTVDKLPTRDDVRWDDSINVKSKRMPTKIPVNGFGRLGKLAMMAQTWPYLMEGQHRMLTRSMKEWELREIEEADLRHGLDCKAQTYALTRKPDNSYVFHPHDSVVTDAVVDTSGLPNVRYHDRTFPKDYAKKKKARRRQQKQARRKNK